MRARRARPGETSVVVGPEQSSGSGFVIDADGYIMTNAHVVNGARRIQVVLRPANADGSLATALTPRPRIVNARIVGLTTELDLALLKVDDLCRRCHWRRIGAAAGRDGVRLRQPGRTP